MTNSVLPAVLLFALILSAFANALANPPHGDAAEDITDSDPKAAAAAEQTLLSSIRQLTFEGRRAGEGYFDRNGTQMVFQSERESGNPFFQIFLMDLETGDVERVSPGHGKTTCAWIHPSGNSVLYASTHNDPDARQKQKDELDLRASGKERRYAWDYDPHFDLYEYDRESGETRQVTTSQGYDAEASWSPDGQFIAFTSNRQAYERELTEEEQKNFDIDPAYLNEIYVMNSDGSNLRRLTSVPGYDGGPFFSPDGQRICWRRFTPNGAIAEIWTMNVDGSDQRQLTRLGTMSWAPFYHPSGEYLIFTTNKHGFSNFELYLVDVEAKSQPVRVSYTKGFDGLPVFTPDGNGLAWTSNRTSAKRSQIFVADWNHEHARQLLGLGREHQATSRDQDAKAVARATREQTRASFSSEDLLRHVDYLCRDELAGRLTGTAGEKMATAYVAAYLDSLGLEPAGDDGGWFQEFEFTSGVALGEKNTLSSKDAEYEVNKDWRPLSFSGDGGFDFAQVVFAGYGMQAAKDENHDEYDSYVHLDVKGKWVLAFRYMPENVSAEQRQQLSRASQLRFKATVARDKGARGLIIVTGPNAKAKSDLVPLRLDGILAGSSLPVISVTDDVAQAWLNANGKTLKELQDKLDDGSLFMGFEIKDVELAASIEVERVTGRGRNVLGRLPAGDSETEQVVLLGAHVDHLGKGANSSSLARDDEEQMIHFGADDNASGVAAMLEVAEYLADLKSRGKLDLRRDVLFAAWSGEELGLLGSDHFVKSYGKTPAHPHAQHHHGAPASNGQPQRATKHHSAISSPATVASQSRHSDSIYPAVAACLNMDMVGRLTKSLVLQGVGSSSIWRGEIERRNAPVGLSITLQEDSYLPTDAKSFYTHGVPVLSAFTGSHSEYHTPRDTPDTLNYEGAAQVARLMALITRSIAMRDAAPDYQEQAAPQKTRTGGRLRAYLGTIPDYAEEVKGVLLSGARKGGPADKAGVRSGDIIVELAGKKIENIYDYTHAIEGLKIDQKTQIVVQRGEERISLDVVPGSRE